MQNWIMSLITPFNWITRWWTESTIAFIYCSSCPLPQYHNDVSFWAPWACRASYGPLPACFEGCLASECSRYPGGSVSNWYRIRRDKYIYIKAEFKASLRRKVVAQDSREAWQNVKESKPYFCQAHPSTACKGHYPKTICLCGAASKAGLMTCWAQQRS